MILDRFSITCTKYVWASNVELPDVNIFSEEAPIPGETVTIDLKPYLMDISDITWDLDTTDEEDGKSNLFFEESDVSYSLSGIVNNSYLIEFFGLYRNTTREKYLVQIIDNRSGNFIHRGIVSQELIEITYSPAKDSEVLKVTAMGYLKEFKAYFSSVPMLHNDYPNQNNEDHLTWTRTQNLPNVIHNSGGYPTWGCSMQSLLEQSFQSGVVSINFILEPDVAEWFIIKNPCLSKRLNYIGLKPDNTCWIKSSYERIRANGENRFDFIRRLCNAMGWVFYFSDNNFYIKNRSPIENAQVLDYNNIIEFTLTKQKETSEYENILILNGDFSIGLPLHVNGWGHFDGARLKIFTSKPTSKYDRWWTNIPNNGDLIQGGIQPNSSWRIQKFHSEDSNEFKYCFIKTGGPGWEINPSNIYSLRQKSLLRIDAGGTGSSAWAYDTEADPNGLTFPREFTFDPGEDELQWTGNYGSAMFKIDSDSQVYNYEEYKESTIFQNNFSKFSKNNLTRRAKLKYKGLITSPLQKYTFINSNNYFEGEWVTVSLKVDLKTEISTIEIQLKE